MGGMGMFDGMFGDGGGPGIRTFGGMGGPPGMGGPMGGEGHFSCRSKCLWACKQASLQDMRRHPFSASMSYGAARQQFQPTHAGTLSV